MVKDTLNSTLTAAASDARVVRTKSHQLPLIKDNRVKRVSPTRSPIPKIPPPKSSASPYSTTNVPTTIHLPSIASSQPLPFSNSLYQSMLASQQRLSVLSSTTPTQQTSAAATAAHSSQSALLLAQSMYNAAKAPLLALPHSIVLGADPAAQVGGKLPLFSKTTLPISVPKSSNDRLNSSTGGVSSSAVKKEPSLPLLGFSLPVSSSACW